MERNYVIITVCLPGVWKVKHLCVSTAGLTALSNMPVIGSSPVLVADDERSMADDDDSWIKDDFATTPIMSTYLLAFVVADFRSRQTTGHHGLKVRNNNNYYIIAKFHYTGPNGPARTRTDPNDPDLRETPLVRAGLRQSPCGSARVRSGPVVPV